MKVQNMDSDTASTISVMERTVAEAPFNDPNADFVLVSSDAVLFYVHKILLAIVSPVFETMLSLPTDEYQEKHDGRPCVQLADEATKLRLLLSWCDQRCTDSLRSTDLDDLHIVLELADKYSMEPIISHVHNVLLGMKSVIASRPFQVFCIAARFRLRAVAHAAAREALKLPLTEWNPIAEMNHITAFTFARLLQYHQIYVAEVQDLTNNDIWSIWEDLFSTAETQAPRCESSCPVLSTQGGARRAWYVKYMQRAAEALGKRPSGTTLNMTFLQILSAVANETCSKCRPFAASRIVTVQKHLIYEIEEKISQMELSFGF